MKSVCIFCGIGCELNYEVKDNTIIKVSGGCIKGLMIPEMYNKNRITHPRIKGKKTTYEKALEYIYKNTRGISPNEVFFNTSGKITNENNFAIQEFARTCFNTSNIDSCCGRLCHAATVMGMQNIFGTPNLTDISNLSKIDVLLIVGSEPEKNYPIFYSKVLQHNIKQIRINPFLGKNTYTIRPGTECCILNGIINELIKKGLKKSYEGFDLLKRVVKKYTPKYVCEITGLNLKNYKKLVNEIYSSKSLGIFHGMGLTQHLNSIENVHSLLNLCLLKDAKIFTLRGEINVQGAGDLMPNFCKKPTTILDALYISPVKAVFITEFNPLRSLPDIDNVKKRLRNTFIVYFGSYENETSKSADVVIPIASLLGSKGTITNGERKIKIVNKIVDEGKELWQILCDLSKYYGRSLKFSSSQEIFNQIKSKVRDYSSGTPDKKIKWKRFMPEEFDGVDELPSKEYPFILTTYRSAYAFLTGEITKNSKTLNKFLEKQGIYLNPSDFKKLGLKQGEFVLVRSRVSSLKARAYVSEKLPQGLVGAYIHTLPINKLFPMRFDEESFTPNYKCIPVSIKKI